MFLQSLCLAAHERGRWTVAWPLATLLVIPTHARAGLATCMQEAWHVYHATVRRQLRIPDDQVSALMVVASADGSGDATRNTGGHMLVVCVVVTK